MGEPFLKATRREHEIGFDKKDAAPDFLTLLFSDIRYAPFQIVQQRIDAVEFSDDIQGKGVEQQQHGGKSPDGIGKRFEPAEQGGKFASLQHCDDMLLQPLDRQRIVFGEQGMLDGLIHHLAFGKTRACPPVKLAPCLRMLDEQFLLQKFRKQMVVPIPGAFFI